MLKLLVIYFSHLHGVQVVGCVFWCPSGSECWGRGRKKACREPWGETPQRPLRLRVIRSEPFLEMGKGRVWVILAELIDEIAKVWKYLSIWQSPVISCARDHSPGGLPMDKKTFNAKEILTDIKAGRNNAALMEKCKISDKGLQSLFEKLMDAGVLKRKQSKASGPFSNVKGATNHADGNQVQF